jgi:hypothetical protein
MKTCNRCGETKELELFSKASSCRDGHRNYCKTCHSKYKHSWYKANQLYHYIKCKDWNKRNPEKGKEYKAKYNQKPESKILAKQYRYLHKTHIANTKSTWLKSNRWKATATGARYKAAKLQRTPIWVDEDDLWLVKEAYDLAEKRSIMTNISWHVDHIIPLQGKIVSGLHVIANLQVIPAKLNISKGNRYHG